MVIVLWSRGIANVSSVQYLVLATNLLKAVYDQAKENTRGKKEREADGYLFAISLLSLISTLPTTFSIL